MTRHPLDVDLVELVEHMRDCELCRRKMARILYEDVTKTPRQAAEDEVHWA